MNSREIIRKLIDDGWFKVARRGSHVQFKYGQKKGRVTMPHPKKEDLPMGTVRSVYRQAGWPLRGD